MRLGGILFALIVAAAAAFVIVGSIQAVTQKLEGHIQARSQYMEAAAPKISGGPSIADSGHSFKHHLLLPVLNAGSEGSL